MINSISGLTNNYPSSFNKLIIFDTVTLVVPNVFAIRREIR